MSDFTDRLESVDGIGPKTASKIEDAFGSEEELVEALQDGSFIESFEDEPFVLQFVDELTDLFSSDSDNDEDVEDDVAPEASDDSEDEPKDVKTEAEEEEVEDDVEPELNFRDPNFDWGKNEHLWRKDPEAVKYWLLFKT